MVEPISISITVISLIKGITKAIDEAKKTIDSFNTEYDKLRTNLEDLTPRIESVNQFDEAIADLSKNDDLTVKRRTEMDNLVKQLKDCQELVEKCSHLSFWKYHKIKFYTEKLKGCNESLKDFVTRLMVADIWEVAMTNRRVKYESSVPEPPKFTVGWTEPVGELKQKLLQEEVPVIGICGPGGCGKSTLAKKLCEQVKDKFERISYISIPRSPDSPTEKKEAETLNWIALFNKLWDDLVGTPKPSKFESAEGALELLKLRLGKRKMTGKGLLVVLDGVWSDNMLKKFVIGTPGLKTLVTARVELEGLNWSYPVQQLTMKDAKNLFLHHALLQGRPSENVDGEMVEQIVEGCKFYPLALEVVGASLKKADSKQWRTTAENLQRGQIFDKHEKIFWPLNTSLESLTPTQRECFMDLCCFPDNKRIRAAALMDMWVHTRGQDEDAYGILRELADRHLIELFKRTRNEDIDIDESFGDLFVIQHDLLTDLAVYVSKKEKLNTRLVINKGDSFPDPMKQNDILSQAQVVSIHTGDSVNFDWVDVAFPCAEVLILNFSTSSYCLPPFLKRMENLKVLIIANHYMAAAVLSELPPTGSFKCLRAVRLERVLVPFPCIFTEPFKGVQKLSMILCKVNEEEICSGLDIQTIFPDLVELEIDYCSGFERLPSAVWKIVNVQKLSITNCHDLSELPEEIGKLSKLKVLRLSGCTSLESLPDSLSELNELRFLDIFCCSQVDYLPSSVGMLRSLEKIDLRGCSPKLPDTITDLAGLRDVICDEDAVNTWESVKAKCRRLRVHGCKDVVSLRFLQ